MNNTLKYLIIILCVIFLTAMFIYGKFFAPISNCQRSRDFIKESYSGTVQHKIYDQKNADIMIISIQKDGKLLDILIPKDTTFFGFISIGDSLVKTKNEDFIELHKASITTNFKINFGCDEDIKH